MHLCLGAGHLQGGKVGVWGTAWGKGGLILSFIFFNLSKKI